MGIFFVLHTCLAAVAFVVGGHVWCSVPGALASILARLINPTERNGICNEVSAQALRPNGQHRCRRQAPDSTALREGAVAAGLVERHNLA